jgi:ATP phosphoribosyltransferase regulatory subunit
VQVARIDAHLLNRPSVTRLCYAGSVLHTRPSGLHATREPYQIGAEIYGHAGLGADAEIQELALATLALAGFDKVRLDLCHVGIFGALVAMDPAAQNRRSELYTLLRAKDVAGLREATADLAPAVREALLALPKLYGDSSVLQQARSILPAEAAITRALDDLQALADLAPAGSVTIDLADLAGYEYESGAMFAIYVPGLPNAVARGGRYDHVGEAFGRARPATGFSLDLRELARLMPTAAPRPAIRAPWGRDAALREMIAKLRDAGEIVIQSLPGHENDQDEFECDRVIVPEAGNWTIKKLEQ